MMNLKERTEAFIELGIRIKSYLKGNVESEDLENFQMVIQTAQNENKWFSEVNVRKSLEAVSIWLERDSLKNWIASYQIKEVKEKVIGVIMAGNIPLVGFHDFLSVLITGNKIIAKTSSDDKILLHFLVNELRKINNHWDERITLTDGMMKGFDAIIATGSNNTSRYFEQYFGKYPHIIRKNRSSVAVLDGSESKDDLRQLGSDIFQYFGLGCRNVSKLLLPKDYHFDPFFVTMMEFEEIGMNSKYVNNVDYHKALLLINREKFLDGGFILLKESDELSSPVGLVYYSYYESKDGVDAFLKENTDNIQCVVGNGNIAFGQAQSPTLSDYPDNVDIVEFILNLN